jgi:hypothetical protein
MLHVWLIPGLAVLVLLLGVLYLCVRHYGGGSGVRNDGRCVCGTTDDAEDPSFDEPPNKTYQYIARP